MSQPSFTQAHLSRRQFSQWASLGLGLSSLPFTGHNKAWAAGEAAEPHFFLQLYLPGGWDPTYLMDARPREMVEQRIMQSFLEQPATRYQARHGGESLLTKLMEPLSPFLSEATIINGIHMAVDFDGHEQSASYLMTGNPFGGDGVIPYLNRGVGAPLDYAQMGEGQMLATLHNTSRSMPMRGQALSAVRRLIDAASFLEPQSRLRSFLATQAKPQRPDVGAMAHSKALFTEALAGVPQVAEIIQNLELTESNPQDGADDIAGLALQMTQLLRSGLCKGVFYVFDTDVGQNRNLDTHDLNAARQQPQQYLELMTELATILQTFKDVPLDGQRSLFDVTTIMICSEFSRTMRSFNTEDLDLSGTDHNPFNNSVILLGKGVRGGKVIGASDAADGAEFKDGLSAAHLQRDPGRFCIMGRPWDFELQRLRNDLPQVYNSADYITALNVINTLFDIFGVASEHFHTIGRSGPPAAVLPV